MDANFWKNRWKDGQTGWHLEQPHPKLVRSWNALDLSQHARVLVPLCGKSLDMLWLRDQGCHVTGVDLAEQAFSEFFREILHEPPLEMGTARTTGQASYQARGISLYCQDILGFTPQEPFDAIYDRAAFFALAPKDREPYVRNMYRMLKPGGKILLITLEFTVAGYEGPPFSLNAEDVAAYYGSAFEITKLYENDIIAESPRFQQRGATSLLEAVNLLCKL